MYGLRLALAGLVLSIMMLSPALRESPATLMHFSFVPKVSLLIVLYPLGEKYRSRIVDLPEAGDPTNITTS